MEGSPRTASVRARMISWPVASSAWRMRRREWPPSWPRSYSRSSGSPRTSKFAPSAIRRRTPAGPSRTTLSTTSRRQRPAPAASVSSMCDSKLSSGLQTDAMPPWAYWLELSGRRSFVTRTTRAWRAHSRAQVSPARPLPPGTPMLVPGRPRWFPALLSRPLPRADATVYDGLIRDIAARHGVEYALVKAVIKAESDFDRTAVSRAGALGLMQLMPQTAAYHQVRNVFLPRDNIEGGCRHLRMLLDRYGGNLPLVVAAYHAGTQRVENAGGVPPIAETPQSPGPRL